MDFSSFQAVFDWVIAGGYFLIFIGMLIDGPVVTAAASFASALGYFNILIIFAISVLGDLVADVVYYLIGYWGRLSVAEKYGHYFGLSDERMKKIESLLNDHAIKTLIVLKMMPVLPTPGLMLVGATRMPWRKYTLISFVMTIPKSLFFMVIGYYFGASYDAIMLKLNNNIMVIFIFLAILLLIYFVFKKVSIYIARRIEEI